MRNAVAGQGYETKCKLSLSGIWYFVFFVDGCSYFQQEDFKINLDGA